MRPLLVLGLFAPLLLADGPGDNVPDKVRPVPPKGVAPAAKDRDALTAKLAKLQDAAAELPRALDGKPALLDLLPDVQVFVKAVDWALRHDELFDAADVKRAYALLDIGLARAKELRDGKPSWPSATGLVVRGYASRLGDGVQPYGLVVPPSYKADGDHKHRLDVWLHGRFENVTELRFIDQRLKSPGEFRPAGAFVLHPFGRFSNAFKLAGEVDVLEALGHASRHYRIDDDRVVMRGFSMGGAGCWQMASHYPGRWAAAAPGAGFSETADFLKVFQNEKVAPTWYEKKLWQLYDCPGYAFNFHNLPVVAYSGEKDRQKQAADMMEPAFAAQGMKLVHLIGPGTGHSYHPKTREELNARIDPVAEKGRPKLPPRVRFTTPTLRYNESYWVKLDGLEEHWKPATIDALIDGGVVAVKTGNVSAFRLLLKPDAAKAAVIDGQRVEGLAFAKVDGRWASAREAGGLRKHHGLQGPIDDAFLDRFIIVRPTGRPMHEETGAWVKAEMERAIREWRRQMRGDALVKDDKDVTEADVKSSNLILWGDPSSNAVIAKVLGELPLKWDAKGLMLAGKTHDAAGHVPALVYPNPLNPSRYVVLNSGLTYREYDYLNNARQHAKLPDWAVIDLSRKPDARWPGKVADADFFDESWKVKARKE